MSTMNIAIIGGVVLLVLVLVKMRRLNAADPAAPSTGRRSRSERRRKRGKDTPPAPPEPMPLAAAAGETAATVAPPAMDAPPVEQWPPADGGAVEQWPPLDDAAVEWPPVPDPAAAEQPQPEHHPEAGVPHAAHEAPAAAWSEDELVMEPGWPMPGEVEVAWAPPATHQPIEHTPPAPADEAIAWADETAATVTPPPVEWLSAEPAEEEEAPVWGPVEDEEPYAATEPADETPAWDAPVPAAEEWVAEETAAPEVSWDPAPEHDAQPTGEIAGVPFVEEPAVAFDPEPEAFPVWDAAAPVEAVAAEQAPEPEVFAAPAPEPEVFVATEPETAWWDDAPEAPAAPAQDESASTGRFALGGFAMQPGQQALGGASFRVELPEAPTAWAIEGSPGLVAPGTLVLTLEGTINCAADGLEVVMEPGFAPTTQGFTVRVAAVAAGPFAASGSFRIH